MKDYKELLGRLRSLATFAGYEKESCVWLAVDAIEQLVKDLNDALEDERHAEEYAWKVRQERDALAKSLDQTLAWYNDETVRADRLEAENRAKESYIAETIGKVIKERDAAVADLRDNGRNCITCLHGRKGKNDCLDHKEVPCNWEWRGVQEVAK